MRQVAKKGKDRTKEERRQTRLDEVQKRRGGEGRIRQNERRGKEK